MFIKAPYHANPGAERKWEDQVHMFQDTFFESFQIHQLAAMWEFEHTSHGFLLNFLFKNLVRPSLYVCLLCQYSFMFKWL